MVTCVQTLNWREKLPLLYPRFSTGCKNPDWNDHTKYWFCVTPAISLLLLNYLPVLISWLLAESMMLLILKGSCLLAAKQPQNIHICHICPGYFTATPLKGTILWIRKTAIVIILISCAINNMDVKWPAYSSQNSFPELKACDRYSAC